MGPFVMGFVIQHLSWQWMFWIMAIVGPKPAIPAIFSLLKLKILQMNFAQLIGYLFFGPETLYNREIQTSRPRTQNRSSQLFSFHRIMPKPLSREDFLLPIYLLGDYRVLVSTIAYAITFNFTLVLMTVEIPAFFTGLFHLTPQQIGINFLGLLVGCVLKTRSFTCSLFSF
jgi:hypothetical protein